MLSQCPNPCPLVSNLAGGSFKGNNHKLPSESHFLGVDVLFRNANRSLEQLASQVHRDEVRLVDFCLAHRLLSSLPLSTNEYAVSFRRLTNAHSCCLQSERGAAVYELRLLRSCLRERHELNG